MKPALQLRLGQRLKLTPQLQQAIRLLALSANELEKEIVDALESNPLLQGVEPEPEPGSEPPQTADKQRDDMVAIDVAEQWNAEQISVPRNGRLSTSNVDYSDLDRTIADTDKDDLKSSLMWQLNLLHLSESDSVIGMAIIDAINEDGYLTESIEQIHQSLMPDYEVGVDEISMVLHQIQQFEPAGVAARNLSECLSIQLMLLPQDTPGHSTARQVIDDCLDLLATQKIPELKRRLGVRDDELETAIQLVRSLDARPGAASSVERTQYVEPEVIVRKNAGQWQVALYQKQRTRLTINDFYASMIKSASEDDSNYLKQQLQEAKWLIKSLESRDQTLLMVSSAIIERQTGFFDEGPAQLKPMVMREIADQTGLHESTISRISNRKYMMTPHGIVPFKYFFSSSVSNDDGSGASSTAVQELIRNLINDEPANKPLSDNKLGQLLKAQGINVARRTVAKYREALNIPSSSQRKRLI